MIIFATKNIKFLKWINKIPFLRLFFVLKPDEKFNTIEDNEILERFYNEVYVSSKTAKTTAKNRFEDLDLFSLKYLPEFPVLKIHDVAVSSGITSIDFFELCRKQNIKVQFWISDKYAKVDVSKGKITRVFDQDNKLMLAFWGAFMAMDRNRKAPLSILLFRMIKKRTLRNYKKDYSLMFFHPKMINFIETQKISYLDYDIFHTKTTEKFHFVRCMNILNKVYFNDEEIQLALQNIHESLYEEGILLVGRTLLNGENNASFFKKESNGFVLLADFNRGSEVKELILKKK